MPPASKASLNRLTSVLENEPTPTSDAAAAAMNASTSGRVSGSATGRYHNMNELDALEAILRKAQQGTSRRNSSSNLSMTSPTTRRSTTSAARRYDFSQEALLGLLSHAGPRADELERNPPLEPGIPCTRDHAHAASTEHAADLVTPNLLGRRRRGCDGRRREQRRQDRQWRRS